MTGKKKAAPKRKQRSNQVPGQFYGYSLQITRSVAHLLRARHGQSISVEYLDDVATQTAEGDVAEQDKSGLAHNPIADRSIELWKTLHNWVRAIREGALKSDTKFVLYVAQNHHGTVIDKIHAVNNKAEADELVHVLRKEFLGKATKYAARAKLPSDLAVHVNGVLSASHDVLAHLFVNMTLENGSGSPNDDLLPLIAEKAIGEDAREDVLNHLLGWTKRTLDRLIEKRRPPMLAWEDFHKQLVGAARKHDRSENVLASTPTAISEEDISKELRARTYVHQLKAVECEEPDMVRAVNDFLRSAVDRTSWSERGDVLEGSFSEFEDGLERAWRSQKTRIEIEQKTAAEKDQGRLLYANCGGLQIRLQGMEVPAYFVPGSFHTLADSLRVGWHPRYRELFGTAGVTGPAADEQDETASDSPATEPARQRRPSTSTSPSAAAAAGGMDEVGGA